MASKVELLDLPVELLVRVAGHMRNLEDFNNTACTCRRLYTIFAQSPPNTILNLAACSAPIFFHPHPHYLVLCTARQVATWAVGHANRTAELVAAFRGGMDGLLALCLRVAGLTLADVRRMHLARFAVLNPLGNLLDTMIGTQWYATENFWNGGVSDAFTLCGDVNAATYELLIYGELFGPSLRAFLEPARNLPRFDVATRLEYVLYCVPDWVHNAGEELWPGQQTLATGPYGRPEGEDIRCGNQTALLHLLGRADMFSGGRWRCAWEEVVGSVMPSKGAAAWRKKLWWDAVTQVGGLEGMALVAKGLQKGEQLPEKWRERLWGLWEQIEALKSNERPAVKRYGESRVVSVSDAPDLTSELFVCCAGMWGGL